MTVICLAMRTLQTLAVVAEKWQYSSTFNDRFLAVLAPGSIRAARYGGKDVVRIHRANQQKATTPWRATELAVQLAKCTVQAVHAYGVQMHALSFELDLDLGIIAQRRNKERAIHQRILVVDLQHLTTQNALHFGGFMAAQIGEDETARFVVAMGTFVFHLNVVGILLTARQRREDGKVVATLEDAPQSGLFGVGKEVEFGPEPGRASLSHLPSD